MPTEAEIQAQKLIDDAAKKVVFDDRQQEKVNELLREAQGRAGREARAEAETLKTELATLKSDLEDARRAAVVAKTPASKADAKDAVEALQLEIAELKNAGKTNITELERARSMVLAEKSEAAKAKALVVDIRKENILTQAASKINPFDVEEVVGITKTAILADEDGKFFVVDPATGQPRMNSSYERMSIDEFYQEFAAKKPYMVRSTAKSGTGSVESARYDVSANGKYAVEQIFGKKSSSVLAQALATKDIKEYGRLKQVAINAGLISGVKT